MKTKNSYLTFYKTILEKVSFDQELFQKEYQKAVKTLDDQERLDLSKWVSQQYHGQLN